MSWLLPTARSPRRHCRDRPTLLPDDQPGVLKHLHVLLRGGQRHTARLGELANVVTDPSPSRSRMPRQVELDKGREGPVEYVLLNHVVQYCTLNRMVQYPIVIRATLQTVLILAERASALECPRERSATRCRTRLRVRHACHRCRSSVRPRPLPVIVAGVGAGVPRPRHRWIRGGVQLLISGRVAGDPGPPVVE